MRLCIETDRLQLQKGQTLQLPDARGARVKLLTGELWVTQEGDRQDVILEAGGAFTVERRGITLLHAFKPTLLLIEEPGLGAAPAPLGWWTSARSQLRRLGEIELRPQSRERTA